MSSDSEEQSELEKLRQRVIELEAFVVDGQKSAGEVQRLNENLESQVLQLNVLNAQLKSLTYKLSKARDQAVDASRTKSQFLANMSHEIRTPMNAVIGMSDLLLHSGLSRSQKDFAEIIHDSASNLLDIINDVLDFSKIEAGKLRLELNDFEILPLVEGTTELLAEKARQKQVSLLTFVAPHLAEQFRGDAGRIRQILLNLISNAVKFTESGEIVVRAVVDRTEDSVVFVKFAVTDTGVGIPPESLQHVFEPFVQADNSIKLPHGGTGLGLSICRHLAEMMGGELKVNSTVGRGSTFSFIVPLEISSSTEKTRQPKAILVNTKILLVGLSKTASLILETYLEAWQATCVSVPSAQEAVKSLKTAYTEGVPFLAAIVSSQLKADKDYSPEEFAAEVSRNSSLKNTSVVVFNLQGERLQHPAPKSEFSGYLHTPLKQAYLFECVASLEHSQRQLTLNQTSSHNKSEDPQDSESTIEHADRSQLILVAEDNAVNQKVALLQLERLGFRAHAVANGIEVLDVMQRTPYALIFMDCQMPEMDGYQSASEIRKREILSGKHIPIIAMTAHAMEGDRDKCIAAGMDDYISKPVMPNVLKKALTKWLPESYAPETSDTITTSTGDFDTQTDFNSRPVREQSDLSGVQPGMVNAPVNLQKLVDASGGADLRIISRVYFSTADRALKEATDALIQKDFRGLRALARELELQSNSFSASEMLQLSKELSNSASSQNVTEGKIIVEALKLALETVKTFVLERATTNDRPV